MEPFKITPPVQIIYSVSRLNQEARLLLEDHFTSRLVEGELSNLRCPSSGHWYFTLKDEKSQVNCAMFRMKNSLVDFKLQDGMQVIVRAKVSLYEARGDYQLIIDSMELAGDGKLKRAFEILKRKLHDEGLFALEHKKPLPPLPRAIGIITSSTGAAIRDILSVLKRRFPAIPVIIYPAQVQGAKAADDLVAAIQIANQRQECDVLILARGGGSLEDLWPFNEERVARAIYASQLPIVSGVGHEIDITIADFVADLRAPTPSAAAELIVPDQMTYLSQFIQASTRLNGAMQRILARLQMMLEHIQKRLQHPGAKLLQQMQRVDQLRDQLEAAFMQLLHTKHKQFITLDHGLRQSTPLNRIALHEAYCQQILQELQHLMQARLLGYQTQLAKLAHSLDTISPLATLARGYAIVTNQKSQVVTSIKDVKIGDRLHTKLIDGELLCQIIESL